MCFFLTAHGARDAPSGIEQPCLLADRAATLENFDLPAGLIFDRLMDETDRVHILYLAARAQLAARPAHRHIDVAAHAAFVHIAVAGAEIAQDGAQLPQIGRRLFCAAHVRL